VGSRTFKDDAVVLRSLRFGEADRILHVLTRERGRLGAIAKGARRPRSRFGGRLEPGSRVELVLHEGRGDLATVTGADLIRSHQALALDPYRLRVAQIGLEAVLRLFLEHDPSPRAFHVLVRFLDLLDDRPATGTQPPTRRDPALDPLVLALQLKLLWLAGYLPHLATCAGCGAPGPIEAFSAAAGGAVCDGCATGGMAVGAAGFEAIRDMLEYPLADAEATELDATAAREAARVVQSLHEYHGGFRLRTVTSRG
jgi:DNA repair protein RecO (recombination protein O)